MLEVAAKRCLFVQQMVLWSHLFSQLGGTPPHSILWFTPLRCIHYTTIEVHTSSNTIEWTFGSEAGVGK